ncbi:MAG TPA: membrane protein insertion efficiency factor YidD [Clostridia bacterium]|nr:membrane protein insertion efficiency factor YidD [Clostridia bacterium]
MASGLLHMISFYQRYLSAGHPACCRFSPTCSAYAAEAIQRHGALKGTGLAVWRILRCHPFCKGGYDPVPEKKTNKNPLKPPCENTAS